MSVRPRPTLMVPDELSWTVWDDDPRARGLTPASAPEEARGLLAPEIVPGPLAAALVAELARVPSRPLVIAAPGPAVAGSHVADVLRERHAGHDDEHGHGGHDGGHGHGGHDMMAIVGEPSSDGLVMEPIELELGPLSGVLPGGLVASLRLDGDVVISCELRSTLLAEGRDGALVGDPLAPVAWAVAAAVAAEQASEVPASQIVAWRRVAAVELERAVSHLAWVRAIGRLLGWDELVARAQRALEPALRARRDKSADGLTSAAKRAGKLVALIESRRFAERGRGRGTLDAGTILAGPNGRASGSPRDARSTDALYAELGFAPVVREAGDAEARVQVRAHEAAAAITLAIGALERATNGLPGQDRPDESRLGDGRPDEGRSGDRRPPGDTGFASRDGAAVEGPRGPVLASRAAAGAQPLVTAPGADAATTAAAAAAEGQEWSAALLTIASFDLSAWRVPG